MTEIFVSESLIIEGKETVVDILVDTISPMIENKETVDYYVFKRCIVIDGSGSYIVVAVINRAVKISLATTVLPIPVPVLDEVINKGVGAKNWFHIGIEIRFHHTSLQAAIMGTLKLRV